MNTDQNTKCGSTEFLNFSDALNHLRWGDRIARRNWAKGEYVRALYESGPVSLRRYAGRFGGSQRSLIGSDIMAEDWYVLGEHQ